MEETLRMFLEALDAEDDLEFDSLVFDLEKDETIPTLRSFSEWHGAEPILIRALTNQQGADEEIDVGRKSGVSALLYLGELPFYAPVCVAVCSRSQMLRHVAALSSDTLMCMDSLQYFPYAQRSHQD